MLRDSPADRPPETETVRHSGRPAATESRGGRGAMWLTALLFTVLGLAALGVFLVLPDWVRQRPAKSLTHPATATAQPETVPADDPREADETASAETDDDLGPDAAQPVAPSIAEATVTPPPPSRQRPTRPPAPAQPTPTHGDDAAFAGAMSQGLAALDREDFQAARQAFTRAAGLRPGSPQSADGLARAELGLRVAKVTELRHQALAFEGDEAWQSAAEQYQAILEIDPSIELAQVGRARSGERAELAKRLDRHILNPERMASEEVLADAATTLGKAMEIEPPGPRLAQQITALARLVEAFSTPVQARLESDSLTEVVVYKVGRLGTFERRALELRPGTYTVVGSRSGYRDVRRQLVIAPGTEPAPLAIRCEEEI